VDRQIVYPGQIPLETDLLNSNRYALIGLAKLAAAVLGTHTLLNGLGCAPMNPAALQVQLGAGEIYALANLDGTAYSSLAADTTHSLLKQGLLLDAVTLDCPAPATAGDSIAYLVQIGYFDQDSGATALPYYNAANPAQAYSGPNNSGTAQYTVRQGVCQVTVKAGIAATSGSQIAPAPDPGYVGAYLVTVANSQTAITAADIQGDPAAPFIPATLTETAGLRLANVFTQPQTVPNGTASGHAVNLGQSRQWLAVPLSALAYPTIATSDHKIGATAAAATNGGVVSAPSGVMLTLGVPVIAAATAYLGTFTTSAYASADLAVNATYYLRGQISNGALKLYVQQGADTDAISADLLGTPDGASGGGFDSTVLDILLAKVTTGAAGTAPIITNLANAASLRMHSYTYEVATRTTSSTGGIAFQRVTSLALNWARTPTLYNARFDYGINGAVSNPEDLFPAYAGSVTDGTGTLTAAFSRYVFNPVGYGDWNTASTAVNFAINSEFLAMA